MADAAQAHMEITGAVIRVLGDGAEFGEPFDLALFVVGDEGTAILKGLRVEHGAFRPRQAEAVRQCLRRHGFTSAVWHRHTPKGRREVIVPL